jgi:hypothetical protein
MAAGLDAVPKEFSPLQAACFLPVDEDLVAAKSILVEARRAGDHDLPRLIDIFSPLQRRLMSDLGPAGRLVSAQRVDVGYGNNPGDLRFGGLC